MPSYDATLRDAQEGERIQLVYTALLKLPSFLASQSPQRGGQTEITLCAGARWTLFTLIFYWPTISISKYPLLELEGLVGVSQRTLKKYLSILVDCGVLTDSRLCPQQPMSLSESFASVIADNDSKKPIVIGDKKNESKLTTDRYLITYPAQYCHLLKLAPHQIFLLPIKGLKKDLISCVFRLASDPNKESFKLSDSNKLVLMVLLVTTNNYGVCNKIKLSNIIALTGLKRTAIEDAIKNLTEIGIIRYSVSGSSNKKIMKPMCPIYVLNLSHNIFKTHRVFFDFHIFEYHDDHKDIFLECHEHIINPPRDKVGFDSLPICPDNRYVLALVLGEILHFLENSGLDDRLIYDQDAVETSEDSFIAEKTIESQKKSAASQIRHDLMNKDTFRKMLSHLDTHLTDNDCQKAFSACRSVLLRLKVTSGHDTSLNQKYPKLREFMYPSEFWGAFFQPLQFRQLREEFMSDAIDHKFLSMGRNVAFLIDLLQVINLFDAEPLITCVEQHQKKLGQLKRGNFCMLPSQHFPRKRRIIAVLGKNNTHNQFYIHTLDEHGRLVHPESSARTEPLKHPSLDDQYRWGLLTKCLDVSS